MKFNEDSRVKIPALLHLMKLGYTYIPFKEQNRIEENNIFPDIFIPKTELNVKNEFQYDVNGDIFSANYSEEITTLGLADPDLVKYRKLWRYIESKNIDLDFSDADQLKIEVISQALEIGIDENDVFFKLFKEENEVKFQKALKYSYFYN